MQLRLHIVGAPLAYRVQAPYKGGAINFERNGLRPKNFRICGTMGIMCWNFLYFKFSILLLLFIKQKSNFAWLKVLNRYLIYEITCYVEIVFNVRSLLPFLVVF